MTDDNGEFVLQHLTPGAYSLDIYYADLEQHQSSITVGVGEITMRWLWFDTSTLSQESITLMAAARAARQGHIDRTHGAVYGTVRDIASGAPIQSPCRVVAYADAAGGLSRTGFTDEEGRFVFGELPPGPYLLTFYYDRATAEYPVDIVANTWQPAPTAFATAPRVLPEYFARWRTPRIEALTRLSESSLEYNYVVDYCGPFDNTESALVALQFGVAFSNACFLGERPCAPTIARTDYPAFGTSSIWRFNPFSGLYQ